MQGNEYFMGDSNCSKYWGFLIFGVSAQMKWQEAAGLWDALTLAKRNFPLLGSSSVTAPRPKLVADSVSRLMVWGWQHLPTGSRRRIVQ
jgi:hypothetical protein